MVSYVDEFGGCLKIKGRPTVEPAVTIWPNGTVAPGAPIGLSYTVYMKYPPSNSYCNTISRKQKWETMTT